MKHVRRLEKKPGAFRWRGEEVTRLEALSDAVFGFAITLLVVSLEVPRTFEDLMGLMRGFPAFAVCFALLILIWHTHHIFFRRYDLQDNFTITMNAVLLFIVVFYIYPLKFLFGMVIGQLFGAFNVASPGRAITQEQASTLLAIYSAGYMAIFFVFFLLYVHAYRLRDELELNPGEIFDTRSSCIACLIHVGVALLSVIIALAAGPNAGGWAGWVYFLLGPAFTVHGTLTGRKRRLLRSVESTS